MKTSLGDKAHRVLKMMLGLRNARIASAMASYGFTNADLQTGWELLRGLSRAKLDMPGIRASVTTLENLDAWENKWFPIAEAVMPGALRAAAVWPPARASSRRSDRTTSSSRWGRTAART